MMLIFIITVKKTTKLKNLQRNMTNGRAVTSLPPRRSPNPHSCYRTVAGPKGDQISIKKKKRQGASAKINNIIRTRHSLFFLLSLPEGLREKTV